MLKPMNQTLPRHGAAPEPGCAAASSSTTPFALKGGTAINLFVPRHAAAVGRSRPGLSRPPTAARSGPRPHRRVAPTRRPNGSKQRGFQVRAAGCCRCGRDQAAGAPWLRSKSRSRSTSSCAVRCRPVRRAGLLPRRPRCAAGRSRDPGGVARGCLRRQAGRRAWIDSTRATCST
ncbi:MAG: hypothetical protein MZW92_78015 [Comamonadaceae bacterium]|nr:hypothetical protein [Comamonadaceae bacterium]